MGLKSTRWRNPPYRFGSRRLTDTNCVGCGMGLIAPSARSLGRRVVRQYARWSGAQVGLWWWNGCGAWVKGKSTPRCIHANTYLLEAALAQNLSLLRTLACRPIEGKAAFCRFGETGRHACDGYGNRSAKEEELAARTCCLRRDLAARKIRQARLC